MSTSRSWPRWLLILLALGLVGFAVPTSGPVFANEEGESEEDDDEPGDFFEGETTFSPAQVNKAIQKGVQWMRKKQQRSGSWGEGTGDGTLYSGAKAEGRGYKNPAGATALSLYALLKCKIPARDPLIKRGFNYIAKDWEKPGSSYESSVLLLAVCATADNKKTSRASKKRKVRPKLQGKYRQWAQKLINHLLDKRVDRAWRYNNLPPGKSHGGDNDLSSTQLVALAFFSAHQLGIKVKPQIWEDILSYSLEQQEDSGPKMKYIHPTTKKERVAYARGFSYIKGDATPKHGNACGSMTACGLANIMMARHVLSDGSRQKAKWDKRPDAAKVQQAIYDGLAWIEKNWSPFENPPGKPFHWHVYWMYSVERAMDLIGDTMIGGHNWYSDMGQELLNKQLGDGSWNTRSAGQAPHDVIDTSFALLFLKRATRGAIGWPSVTGGSDDAPADNR